MHMGPSFRSINLIKNIVGSTLFWCESTFYVRLYYVGMRSGFVMLRCGRWKRTMEEGWKTSPQSDSIPSKTSLQVWLWFLLPFLLIVFRYPPHWIDSIHFLLITWLCKMTKNKHSRSVSILMIWFCSWKIIRIRIAKEISITFDSVTILKDTLSPYWWLDCVTRIIGGRDGMWK